jgi:hypothetical protein
MRYGLSLTAELVKNAILPNKIRKRIHLICQKKITERTSCEQAFLIQHWDKEEKARKKLSDHLRVVCRVPKDQKPILFQDDDFDDQWSDDYERVAKFLLLVNTQ